MHVWCLVRTCRLQHAAEQNVRHNHAYFIFGRDRANFLFLAVIVPNFFLAAKTAFGSWHAGTRGIHSTGFNIFGSEKRLYGRILPNIKVGTISAKNKSWQTQYFFCFLHVHIVTHFVWPHTPRTQQKNTPKAPPISPHIQHITHTTPCGAGGARDERQRQHAGVAVARPAAAAREVKEGLTPAAGEETEASRRP